MGGKVAGSITVLTDNGEIYAHTRTEMIKIIERGDMAKIVWKSDMDMFISGLFQSNFKALALK
ncbi:MAG: hypothetical protein COB54_08605 [Alphaproteobacteria bacterium]|nr:MAG: hypothetical protein COB54_08605 [Alphaproteobacteria bacterium]